MGREAYRRFWEDVKRLTTGRPQKNNEKHDLNSILLVEKADTIQGLYGKVMHKLEVNDGQQRMTTLIILLNALRNELNVRINLLQEAKAKNSADPEITHLKALEREASALRVLIFLSDVTAHAECSRLRLLDSHRHFFENYIVPPCDFKSAEEIDKHLAEAYSKATTYSEQRLWKASHFFANEFRTSGSIEQLLYLHTTITTRLSITMIEDENNDFLHCMRRFITINDRGIALKPFDRFKAFLILEFWERLLDERHKVEQEKFGSLDQIEVDSLLRKLNDRWHENMGDMQKHWTDAQRRLAAANLPLSYENEQRILQII